MSGLHQQQQQISRYAKQQEKKNHNLKKRSKHENETLIWHGH